MKRPVIGVGCSSLPKSAPSVPLTIVLSSFKFITPVCGAGSGPPEIDTSHLPVIGSTFFSCVTSGLSVSFFASAAAFAFSAASISGVFFFCSSCHFFSSSRYLFHLSTYSLARRSSPRKRSAVVIGSNGPRQ